MGVIVLESVLLRELALCDLCMVGDVLTQVGVVHIGRSVAWVR